MQNRVDWKSFIKQKQQFPKTIYHYTSIHGLYGIINSGEIWTSKIKYSNDSSELLHAIKIAEEYFNTIYDDSNQKRVIDSWINEINAMYNSHIFICSFTKNSDLLSQWRGYGGKTSGYSIGFDTATLIEFANQHKFDLFKCIYNLNKQKQIVKYFFESRLQFLKNNNIEYDVACTTEFLRIASLFKHSSFSEEDEWRLISDSLSCKLDNFKFRTSDTMLIPYYAIPIRDKEKADNRVKIKEIVCGPNPNNELSSNSIKTLLNKLDYSGFKMSISKTPYRNI